MSGLSIWEILGLEPTDDQTLIRRAYSRRLKLTNPEDDAEGFKRLREAFERAVKAAVAEPIAEIEAAYATLGDTPAREPLPAARPEVRQPPAPIVAVSALEQAHIAAIERLVALIDAQPPTPPGVLTPAIRAVLDGEALEVLDTYARTDEWLADYIARNIPRTDPLIDPAIRRFGWRINERDRAMNPALRPIFRRRNSWIFLTDLESPGHRLYRAAQILRQSKARWSVSHGLVLMAPLGAIRELLLELDGLHPALTLAYPEPTRRAWNAYFERPRLSPALVWTCGVLAIATALLMQEALKTDRQAAQVMALALAALLALPLSKFYLVDWPADLFARRWADHAPDWLLVGWAPAALILIGVAAVLPLTGPAAWVVAGLAAANAYWALVTGRRYAGDSPWTPAVRLTARAYLIGAFLLKLAPGAIVSPVVCAIVAGMVAFVGGEQTLADIWRFMLSGPARIGASAGLLIWAAAMVPLLGQAPAETPPLVVGALGVFVLLLRLPTSSAPSIRLHHGRLARRTALGRVAGIGNNLQAFIAMGVLAVAFMTIPAYAVGQLVAVAGGVRLSLGLERERKALKPQPAS